MSPAAALVPSLVPSGVVAGATRDSMSAQEKEMIVGAGTGGSPNIATTVEETGQGATWSFAPSVLLTRRALASLRASFPEERPDAAANAPDVPAASALSLLQLSLSVPSLSLHHETRLEHRNNKKRVEEYAATLLSRPVLSRVAVANEEKHSCITGTTSSSETAILLMENLSESFGVLLDSRLRAYATFLARHGIALAKTSAAAAPTCDREDASSVSSTTMSGAVGMEEKVRSLLEMGASVRARQMTIDFELVHNEAEEEVDDRSRSSSWDGDDDEVAVGSLIPVQMKASMQLEMTGPKGEHQRLGAVRIGADGTATVTTKKKNGDGTSHAYHVLVDLDTRKLLECMIHQASDVVEHVVDAANTSSIFKASSLCRSSSYLAMPPPNMPSGVEGEATTGTTIASASSTSLSSSANPRRSESFLMLPHDNIDEDYDDDVDQQNDATRTKVADAPLVSPDTNAVSSATGTSTAAAAWLGLAAGKRRGSAGTDAIPPLDLNESQPCQKDDYSHYQCEYNEGHDDDDDDDDEYFLQDLSPEACESIVDGIFGGGGNVVHDGGGGGSCRADDRDSGTTRPNKKPKMMIDAPPSSDAPPVLVGL